MAPAVGSYDIYVSILFSGAVDCSCYVTSCRRIISA
jgi:hypothetical protein